MSDAPNPYAVTTLEVGEPVVEYGGRSRLIRWLVFVAFPLLLIGSAAAVMNVRSVVFSGPIMLTYGPILMFLTRKQNQRRFRWFAWTCCIFPIFVFLIIFTLSWSPDDAQTPISAFCCVFTVVVLCGLFATFAWSDPVSLELADVVLNSDAGDSSVSDHGFSSTAAPAKAP